MKDRALYFNSTQLKSRGWTTSMIKQFMPLHDKDVMNPFYRSGPRVKWYLVERTEKIEQTQDWSERRGKSAPRVQAARAVAEKIAVIKAAEKEAAAIKSAEATAEYLSGVSIDVKKIQPDVLLKSACENYNYYSNELSPIANGNSDKEFLERIQVNYLRHKATCYERKLEDIKGEMDHHVAVLGVKTKALAAIAQSYPFLAEECERQRARSESDLLMYHRMLTEGPPRGY